MKITLSGIECAFAHGFQRVSSIEKYEKQIKPGENEDRGNPDNTIPFEFEIPKGLNQGYVGKIFRILLGA